MDFNINEADLATLTKWDTPTICNALELVCPERRGYGFTTKHLFSLDPKLPPVCGFARTATIRAALPSGESDAEMAQKRSAYYEYVAKAPGPKIAVIQDIDPEPGIGAFWGEVQTNIHKGLGAVGAVTNGSFRDVPDSVHADQHGAVMVPADLITKIPDAIELITRREEVILDSVKSADFNIEKLNVAMGQSRDIH